VISPRLTCFIGVHGKCKCLAFASAISYFLGGNTENLSGCDLAIGYSKANLKIHTGSTALFSSIPFLSFTSSLHIAYYTVNCA